tara:strand:+ start:331 stop:1194 length:864 start_codon:yes stop_codon:yes gene_type:complete
MIESYLSQALQSSTGDQRQVLIEAVNHSLLNGGKRIRPLLTIASSLLFSDNTTDFLPLACSFEIIHTYSLIHDDLPSMDNDDLRRGKPTCHIKYGEDIAILAGDTLNTLAFEILATKLTAFPEKNILKLIAKTANLMGVDGLVGGQILDICSTKHDRSLDKLKLLHQKKTGSLIELTIVSPAMLLSVDDDIIECLISFSNHLGLLFQIIDDILDVTGDKKTLGKSPGKDEMLEKLTYPSLLSLAKAKELAFQEKESALYYLSKLKKNYQFKTDYLKLIVEFIYSRQN